MADRRARFVEERRAPQDSLVYDGVGASLRYARERLGLEAAEVAAALRIQLVHLDALERGRFHELPGPAYAIGFIRSYARYLRLDGDAAVAEFKAETSIAPGRSRLVAPEPIGEVRRPRGLLIGASLLLAAAVYGGWMWLQERDRLTLETVPAPPQSEPADADAPSRPAESAAASQAPVAPRPPSGSPPPAEPQPSVAAAPEATPEAAGPGEAEIASDEEESTPPPSPIAPVAPPTLAAEPPTLAAAPPTSGDGPAPQVYGIGNQDARIVLRAKADSWVRISGGGNELVLERTLRTGDTYLVPNRPDLTLWTGNAGGLEVIVDGAPLPPFGALGVSRRDIPLDADRLRGGG